jgi:predicted nucleotidyltransferase component of viral defense system
VIPRAHITAWREHAPWATDAQVEQDLVLSRALLEIFCDRLLGSQLAFRGATALHKLYLSPATRYSVVRRRD